MYYNPQHANLRIISDWLTDLEAQLKKLLEDHNRWTGSKRARELLDNWAEARGKFVKVFPLEYKRALGEMAARKLAAAAPAKAASKPAGEKAAKAAA